MDNELSRNERLIEDGHVTDRAKAGERLDQVHQVYREVLTALVGSCVKNRVRLTRHEIEVAMEGIGEALAGEAADVLELLPTESYTPKDKAKLIERAHDAIKDSLAVKALDWNGLFNAMFRPVSTNPATRCGKVSL